MKENPSWEFNGHSAGQGISCFLWDLKVKPESNNGSYLYPEESSPHGHTSLL
jgi:hypothetical protein